MFTVVVDACVLVPATLNDTFLSLAAERSYGLRWNSEILDEVERTIIALGVRPALARRRRHLMEEAFPFAMVDDWERFVPALTNDPKDRHVLATAIAGRVDTIVTFNEKDFPEESVAPWNVEIVHPDQFLLNQLDLAPRAIHRALKAMARRNTRPPRTLMELSASLSRCGVPDFADELRR